MTNRVKSLLIVCALPIALVSCSGWDAGPISRPSAMATPVAPVVSQPNVIVIIADDLGYADVSTYFPGRIPTPNIDRLGRDGAVFTQGYVTAPICSPSRAGLMTGRHQQRYGFEYNNGPASRDVAQRLGMDTGEITLANQLKTAGYRTGIVGKWHLGSSDEHYPTNRGFDEFWGFLTGQTNFVRPDAPEAVNFVPPAADTPAGGDLVRPSASVGPNNAVITGPNRQRVDLGNGFLTEQTTEQALSFIERNKGGPFFLYVAHHAPHTPLQVTRKYYDRFPHIKDEMQRIYAGMVSALDDGVGAILDDLDRKGLAKNTIVVFLSDNGCAAYVPGLCSPKPVSGGKLTYLEGGIRVPFLMKWPARIPAGTVHTSPVSSLDVFPTVSAAANLKLPTDRPYDGIDLLPQITAGKNFVRPDMFWRTLPMRVIRDGDWKYYRDLDGNEFLYDLKTDPREITNKISDEPVRAAAMKARFDTWESGMVPPKWPGRSTNYEFDGRKFKFTP